MFVALKTEPLYQETYHMINAIFIIHMFCRSHLVWKGR